MSADEDTELKDLVAQTLENNGVLGKIRAELRASVFLALEEQEAGKKDSPFVNEELKSFLATKEGYHAASLVKEFLEYFNLDFTLAVFNPESNISDTYEGRETLASELQFGSKDRLKGKPLLSEVLRRCHEGGEARGRQRPGSAADENAACIPKDLTAAQIDDARAKFEQYDKDKSGAIDKDELRSLFVDIFPNFHRTMLDRYVNDEFRASDRDFSSEIDFDEFLDMYRRLFVTCRSVVSHDVSDILPTSPLLKPSGSAKAEEKKPVDSQRKIEDDLFSPLTNRGQHSSVKGGSHSDEIDAFFDDPLAGSNKVFGNPSRNQKQAPPSSPPMSPIGALTSLTNAPPLGGSGLGSLTGAPPLNTSTNAKGSRSPDWGDLEEIDNKISKLGFDMSQKSDSSKKSDSKEKPTSDASQDYEDDFQSSQDSPSQTPRGTNSQKSYSISEEISEEISGDDSYLASSQDNFDDQTSDRTVSQLSQSGPFDYMEEVRPPTGV